MGLVHEWEALDARRLPRCGWGASTSTCSQCPKEEAQAASVAQSKEDQSFVAQPHAPRTMYRTTDGRRTIPQLVTDRDTA